MCPFLSILVPAKSTLKPFRNRNYFAFGKYPEKAGFWDIPNIAKAVFDKRVKH